MKMHNVFEHTYKGLNIICVEQKSFKKSYVGIGARFGGGDFLNSSFQYSGLAHYIEHQLFQMPTGDTFESFAKQNAKANAYTTIDKTIYYFTTIHSIYKPLELLLTMYFTPYFKKEAVEKEKGIILSEIEEVLDDIQSEFAIQMLNHLYPKDPFSSKVVGETSSIKKMNENILLAGYKRYYTTKNSVLVLITPESHQDIFDRIKTIMDPLPCSQKGVRHAPMVISDAPKPSFTMTSTSSQTMVSLGIRFRNQRRTPQFCNAIIAILDSILSPTSKFYQELYQDNLFYADIDYMVHQSKDASYVMITTYSLQPEAFIKRVIEKLKNLSAKEIDKNSIIRTLKYLKAKYITNLDDISILGDEVLSLALEGLSYFKEENVCLKLTYEEIIKFLVEFHNAFYSYGICKKNENK